MIGMDTANTFMQGPGTGDLSSFFHLDRFREQNVVLEMDMLVQVLFEAFQRFVKRLVSDARIGGRLEIVGQPPYLAQVLGCGVMLAYHHANRISSRSKRG